MQLFKRSRLFALSFALTIALIAGGFAYASRAAAPPLVYLLGPQAAPCPTGGAPVSTGPQGVPFGVGLRNFYAAEPVYISLTLPDGRVFSPSAALLNEPDTANGLDSTTDTPPNPAYAVVTNAGGDYYALLPTNGKWPLGCYTVSALGVQSGNHAAAIYQMVSDTATLTANGAMLEVQSKASKAASGPQGSTVEVFGRGFLAEEAIALSVVQPNGTTQTLTSTTTSVIGSFQTRFDLDESYATGEYRVIAQGHESGVADTFTLSATTVIDKGFGRLRIARPADLPSMVTQGESFELQGQQFFAGEPLVIAARRPDGSVGTLATAGADELGAFATELTLSSLMPTGTYTLSVAGELSGYRSTLRLELKAGSPNISDETLAPASAAPDLATPASTLPTDPPTAQPAPGGSVTGNDFGKGIDDAATPVPLSGGSGATGSATLRAGGAPVQAAPMELAPTSVPTPATLAPPQPSF